ncbi:unnamed protein product [Cladocopium goreaui]|uniref:Uncharacterized protein n=1 Tax=Cladocopium goreaui TaxID=2562237 RepID=A0A9P1FH94_9DINO|nr:unnamed protein product [Cladocopium goreaui]
MPISRSMQSDHDLSFDEDSASASSIDIGTGLGNRPLGGGTGAARSRGGGEFGGEIGGDSYSFSVPTGTESYLRANDIMGSRGTSAKTGSGAAKAVTKWAAKSVVRKPAIDDLDDPSNRPGTKTGGTKKEADFNAFLENDSGSASSIDLGKGGTSSAARPKAGKASPQASSKSGAKAVTKAVTKSAAKSIVRKTAIDADLDDRYRQMGMKTTGGPATAKKESDFNAFLEESDSEEDKPPKAAPKKVPKGQTADSASASASPEASPRSGAVLSRSPAKISNFAKKTKSPGDASPSSSQVSRSASRSAPASPRSASPSRSPSRSRHSPSPSQSARSRSNTPRSARSASASRSARSRSDRSASGLSAGSVRSPPAGISSFGKIRQMSDLVIPQVAKAASTPGVAPAKASPPFATQRSKSQSGDNYTEDFTADSASVPARRPSMSYEDDFEASSVDTPKPATKAATTSAAKRPSPEAARSRSASRSALRSARSRSDRSASGLSAGSVRSPPAGISSFGKIRQMSDLVIPQVAKAASTPGVAQVKARAEASSVDTPKPTPKAAATSPAKAAVAAAAAASAAKPGFTSVASVAMGSAVPKLALDPLKTSQPVAVAPVAMAQAAEPSRNAWIEERPKPATRDANVQVSIPVDVGVQCDLLSDPMRAGWQQQMPWPHFPPQAEFKGPTSQPSMQAAGPWWPPCAYPWPWPPFPGAMGPMGSMGSMGSMGPAPAEAGSSTGRGQLGPALWALRMVDDSFRDQIDLLRQAAARHRSLLEKSRVAASAEARQARSPAAPS